MEVINVSKLMKKITYPFNILEDNISAEKFGTDFFVSGHGTIVNNQKQSRSFVTQYVNSIYTQKVRCPNRMDHDICSAIISGMDS